MKSQICVSFIPDWMKHLKQCLAHCELSTKILKMNVNVSTKCQMQNTLAWRNCEVMVELNSGEKNYLFARVKLSFIYFLSQKLHQWPWENRLDTRGYEYLSLQMRLD